MPGPATRSREALHELIDLLREIDDRFAGEEYGADTTERVKEAHRAVMHMLQGGLVGWFEDDPEQPRFERIVSPTRKFTGDNPDALYYDAAIRGDREYRVTGNMAGAQYVSITIETGSHDGSFSRGTAGVINDTQFDVDAEGNFEIFLGGEPRSRNWLALDPDASRVTTRHYIEAERCSAADPTLHIPLSIEALGERAPSPAMDDDAVAAGIRRVKNFVLSRTLRMPPPSQRTEMPPFVSPVVNQLVAPIKPGAHAFAAFDAAYSQASFQIGPGEALVIRGRWPECRTGTVCLWTRHIQTFDYANRQTSLNRRQTKLEPDGSWKMIVAHDDPGHPNWLDTEGRTDGTIFIRFMLPEGPIETPVAELVKLSEL